MTENSPTEVLLETKFSRYYENGLSHGLPPLLQPELLSTPFNSTPYVVSIQQLHKDFGFNSRRRQLLSAMEGGLESFEHNGLYVPFVLIGGSFTQLSCLLPSDLDAVFLYRQVTGHDVSIDGLSALRQSLLSKRIDARMIPLDGDQLILLKSFGYFCLLLSKKERGSLELAKSLLILNRREK